MSKFWRWLRSLFVKPRGTMLQVLPLNALDDPNHRRRLIETINTIIKGQQEIATTQLSGVGTILAAYKTAQTARSSTVTQADDPHLIVASVPAGTYAIKGFLQPQCPVGGTQGFQFGLRVDGTKSGSHSINTQGIINAADYPHVRSFTITSVQQYANISTSISDFINFEAIVTTTTAGDIAVQWSQRSSSANATLLNDRSWMTLTRVG